MSNLSEERNNPQNGSEILRITARGLSSVKNNSRKLQRGELIKHLIDYRDIMTKKSIQKVNQKVRNGYEKTLVRTWKITIYSKIQKVT